MGRRPVCDLDKAYRKLASAIESMKDAIVSAEMALVEMPAPAMTCDEYSEPTYIGEEDV